MRVVVVDKRVLEEAVGKLVPVVVVAVGTLVVVVDRLVVVEEAGRPAGAAVGTAADRRAVVEAVGTAGRVAGKLVAGAVVDT